MTSFASGHKRRFDKWNLYWDNYDRKQNPIFVAMVQQDLNDLLQTQGYVSLNTALELLGFERTIEGGQNGWLRDVDPSEGDGYIYFGVWDQGFAHGRDWMHGKLDVMTISFNVDRVRESMPRRVRRQIEEGKIRCDFSPA